MKKKKISLAIKDEKAGAKEYAIMARQDALNRKTFSKMAKDEKRHLGLLRKMK